MSSPWRSCKLRKDPYDISTSAGLRTKPKLSGSKSAKALTSSKGQGKTKQLQKPKETEY